MGTAGLPLSPLVIQQGSVRGSVTTQSPAGKIDPNYILY